MAPGTRSAQAKAVQALSPGGSSSRMRKSAGASTSSVPLRSSRLKASSATIASLVISLSDSPSLIRSPAPAMPLVSYSETLTDSPTLHTASSTDHLLPLHRHRLCLLRIHPRLRFPFHPLLFRLHLRTLQLLIYIILDFPQAAVLSVLRFVSKFRPISAPPPPSPLSHLSVFGLFSH